MRQALLDQGRGFDEVEGVPVVFLDAGSNCEDIRVEDDVGRVEAHLVDQDAMGPFADRDPSFERVRLAGFVERHDDDGGAVAADRARLSDELRLAFLEADRVDDRLALHALEAGLEYVPAGRIDHHGYAGDVRLPGQQIEESAHRRDRVQHPLVHVDVDDLCPVLDLLPRHVERGGVVVRLDQSPESGRSGYVDEQRLAADVERLQPREPAGPLRHRQHARCNATDGLGDTGNVFGRRAATAADQVDQALSSEVADGPGHRRGVLLVLSEGVGETRIRVDARADVGDAGEFGHIGSKLLGA